MQKSKKCLFFDMAVAWLHHCGKRLFITTFTKSNSNSDCEIRLYYQGIKILTQ